MGLVDVKDEGGGESAQIVEAIAAASPERGAAPSWTPRRADLVELRLDLMDLAGCLTPRWPAAAAGRSRHLPGGVGRRPVPGQRGGAPRHPDPGASSWGPTTSTSNGRPRPALASVADRDVRPRRAVEPSTSKASRPTSPTRACGTCAVHGGDGQDRGDRQDPPGRPAGHRRGARRARRRRPGTVVIAMGTAPGLATRVLPEHVGSCWTYGGNGVAPGAR